MDAKKLAWLLTGALVVAPIAANALSVTYDFTGAVTSASGIYSSIGLGATVTGTYTFDLVLADTKPALFGTLGSRTSSWHLESSRGGPLFLSIATVDGFSYASSLLNAGSTVYGNPYLNVYDESVHVNSGHTPEYQYQAFEGSCAAARGPTVCNQSNLTIVGAGWTNAGLPLFSGDSSATGYFREGVSTNGGPESQVTYSIASLVAAPAIDPLSTPSSITSSAPEIDPPSAMGALTLLAGGLAALRGRRGDKQEAQT